MLLCVLALGNANSVSVFVYVCERCIPACILSTLNCTGMACHPIGKNFLFCITGVHIFMHTISHWSKTKMATLQLLESPHCLYAVPFQPWLIRFFFFLFSSIFEIDLSQGSTILNFWPFHLWNVCELGPLNSACHCKDCKPIPHSLIFIEYGV